MVVCVSVCLPVCFFVCLLTTSMAGTSDTLLTTLAIDHWNVTLVRIGASKSRYSHRLIHYRLVIKLINAFINTNKRFPKDMAE